MHIFPQACTYTYIHICSYLPYTYLCTHLSSTTFTRPSSHVSIPPCVRAGGPSDNPPCTERELRGWYGSTLLSFPHTASCYVLPCRSSCSTPATSTWLSSCPLEGTPPWPTVPPATIEQLPCSPPHRDPAAFCPSTPQTLSRCASTGLGFRKPGGYWAGGAAKRGVWERLWCTTGSRSLSRMDKWGGEMWSSYLQDRLSPTPGEPPLVCTPPLLGCCMWAYLSTRRGEGGLWVSGARRWI